MHFGFVFILKVNRWFSIGWSWGDGKWDFISNFWLSAYILYFQTYCLFKAKHSICKLFVDFFAMHIGIIRIRMKSIEEFNNMKPASIYIEMNVALLKIRSYCLPYSYLWMKFFNFAPCGISDSLAVNMGWYK